MKVLRRLPPKEITADLLIIGMSIVFLWEFSHIWLEGRVCFEEPNIAIRTLETCMLVAILTFSIRCFIRHVRQAGMGVAQPADLEQVSTVTSQIRQFIIGHYDDLCAGSYDSQSWNRFMEIAPSLGETDLSFVCHYKQSRQQDTKLDLSFDNMLI